MVGPLAIGIVAAGGVRGDKAELAAHRNASNAKLRGVKRTPPGLVVCFSYVVIVVTGDCGNLLRVCLFVLCRCRIGYDVVFKENLVRLYESLFFWILGTVAPMLYVTVDHRRVWRTNH